MSNGKGITMNIDTIWASLETTGKFASSPLRVEDTEHVDEVKARLYAEAKEYGVRLTVIWSLVNDKFYAYLRKNAG